MGSRLSHRADAACQRRAARAEPTPATPHLARPQVLFFGYSTLDAILAGPSTLRQGGVEPAVAAEALTLLVAKLAATAICLGSGLVGGTFAPSLFLGAVLGVAFHGAAASGLDAAIGVLQQVGRGAQTHPLSRSYPAFGVGRALHLADLARLPSPPCLSSSAPPISPHTCHT